MFARLNPFAKKLNSGTAPLTAPAAAAAQQNARTNNFAKWLGRYKNAVKGVTNQGVLLQKMQNMNGNKQFSATLNNSIVSAFKNTQAAATAVSAATQEPALETAAAPIVANATQSLETLEMNLKREVTNAKNLNALMNKIITANMKNNNAKANAYLTARGANRLGNNVKLNGARGPNSKWQTILAAATKRTSPGVALPTRNLLNGEVSAAKEAANLAAASAAAAALRANANAALAVAPPAVVKAYENMTPANLLKVTSFRTKNNQNKFIAAVNKKLMSTNLTNANKTNLQKLKNNYTGSETSTPASVNYKTMSVANLLSKVNSVPNSNKIALRNAIIAKRKNKNTGGPAKEKLANALMKLGGN